VSWRLRELLQKDDSQYEVVKKRLFLKAAELSGIQFNSSLLEGHIGVVFVSQADAIVPAKTVFKFSEENGKLLEVLEGFIEGKIMPGAELEMLSKLPGIDEMRAGLLALFVSPMSHVLSVMEAAIAGPLAERQEKSES
jgi:large subunit ribosomal protein L10